MLTYNDLAKKLGIPRGTLSRKIAAYNAHADATGGDKILPDEERPTGATQHLFKPERIQEIKHALDSLKARGRGRPRTQETA
jgi:hypothetical protein